MSETCTIEVAFPEELIERLARCVAELIRAAPPDENGGGAESPWMTVRDAAAYLGCSRHTLYRYTAAKAIPHRKRRGGQGLLFRRDELDRWIEAEYEAESVRP
jgi:excisionase family DNA binding protein